MSSQKTPSIANQSIEAMAVELRQIAEANWKGYDAWAESDTGVLDQPRVRELGEQADRIAGFSGMTQLMEAAFSGHADRRLSMACITELNMRWNGIGFWMA